MASYSAPLSQTLTPKKSNLVPVVLLGLGIVIAVVAGIFGFLESRRTEKVVIAARGIVYGQIITADDLATIELPLHRPVQVAGIADPNAIIGQYAARQIGPNDLFKVDMLMAELPADPIYPNGRQLRRNHVPVPFALSGIGPITDRDTINIGFVSTDPNLCDRSVADVPLGTMLPSSQPQVMVEGVPPPPGFQYAYVCRFLSHIPILWLDGEVAWLEMTPVQAQILRALQAAGISMWSERYGALSTPLLSMDRMDVLQITLPDVLHPVSDTIRIEPYLVGEQAIPNSPMALPIGSETASIPGSNPAPIPGTAPTAAPAPTAVPEEGAAGTNAEGATGTGAEPTPYPEPTAETATNGGQP